MKIARVVPFGTIEFEQREAQNGRPGYRAYHVVGEDGARKRFVSVTSFLGVLDKPALVRWREDMTVQAAVGMERSGVLGGVAPEEAADLLRANKLGADEIAKRAAERGTAIHAGFETFLREGRPPNPADFAEEHRGYLRGLSLWLLSAIERGLEVEAVEQLVAHPQLEYAGRYDLRAKLGGLSYLIDLKTNKQGRVWPEHHYQPTAYAMADVECGSEPVHACLLVAVGPDGNYEEMLAKATPADVKAVLTVYRRAARLRAAVQAEHERLEAVA